MLRRLGLAVALALGLCGVAMSAGSASAAVVPSTAGSGIAEAAQAAPGIVTQSQYYRRPYYRPYHRPYYRPYRYGPRCRWVSRRVYGPYGYRYRRVRVCRY
jgi:hypothetical protein